MSKTPGNGSQGGTKPPKQDAPAKQRSKTQDELGEMYKRKHREEFAFLYGAWHSYCNGLWTIDDVRHRIAAWELLKVEKARGIKPTDDLVSAVLRYAMLWLRPGEEQQDSSQYINLRNGLYNLKTGELEPHRRELYMTSQLGFEYDPAARCPVWEKFLEGVFPSERGGVDYPLIALLQQAFGYSLTEQTHHRASFWLVGASGTGKSTLLNVLIALAGDSHAAIDLEFLTKNEYQFAHLPGKRVVTFTEPSAGTKLEDGAYKRLVSQDTITGRHPHGKPFQFVPHFKVWGAMNELPRVADRSDAVFNRVVIIPMNRVVPPAKRDTWLIDKLMSELPGIFNWALEGLKSLTTEGRFETSVTANNARNEWKTENDTEAAFVEDMCIRDANASTPAREIYRSYRDWCKDNGYYPKAERSVSRDWQRMGFNRVRTSGGTAYKGVRLVGGWNCEHQRTDTGLCGSPAQ